MLHLDPQQDPEHRGGPRATPVRDPLDVATSRVERPPASATRGYRWPILMALVTIAALVLLIASGSVDSMLRP